MKLTSRQLRQIIREELTRSLNEDDSIAGEPLPQIRKVLPWPGNKEHEFDYGLMLEPGNFIIVHDKAPGDGFWFWSIKESDLPISREEILDPDNTRAWHKSRISERNVEELTELAADKLTT